MIIAIASGKGGTGKTTISVAMAYSLDEDVQLLDCDVEEPNAHIFLNTDEVVEEKVYVPIPIVDKDLCTFCGKCADICEYNAIAVLKDDVMIFSELCHSCGGCKLVCEQKAISEKNYPIGIVASSTKGNIKLIQGMLDIGRAMAPPIIRAVKSKIKSNMINIIDCPPGNACPVITAVNGADYVVLVTEATPFGLNDLILSVETMREINIPFGVIINRCDTGDLGVVDYLNKEDIDILLEIPESIEVAQAYSKGKTINSAMPDISKKLTDIIENISRGVL